ncbi:phosphoribosylamine--glycine ligase [Rapidithrix thailandica]|uniref:Phosphoribosylamine--glycine ligase n=1 Tax=Rapidithrix thailandica TaxID=413964 RepID=A0AAW9SGH2_9BACT
MNVLVIGSGGREHTLAWKIAQSPKLSNLYVAPGNAGTAAIATNVELGVSDFDGIAAFAKEKNIDLVIVGPEAPLVEGIVDYFKKDPSLAGIKIIGPDKQGALLEGSKDFAKNFMLKYEVPTGHAKTFDKDTLEAGLKYLESVQPPFVLKADGLAAGKGVIITEDLEEAKTALKEMVDGKFGEASANVLIEQFLKGIELSVFVLTDGKDYVILPSAKDYKRIGEGDSGLNTGGMGAVSPVPFADEEFMEKVERQVVKPTMRGLQKEGIDFNGFIFFGLMNAHGDPYVIEYNVRMGDPETEVVMPLLKNDLLELFQLTAEKRLSEAKIEVDNRTATTVMLVSGGYPESYEKGKEITGLDQTNEVIVLHAGTRLDEQNRVLTNGGRVIALTAFGDTMEEALAKSYKAAEAIAFDKKYYRSDIGFDLK